ncbi:unnamed protein product [Brassicogethes aeneus]|uniref:Transmembrane protein 267 n=1 Tax=Brassicogethes aeneus TaxID=1431903 RepID=A0A9P0FGP9_BRAAE|nr:unnamed protein product [Brassicogethes aeneus]
MVRIFSLNTYLTGLIGLLAVFGDYLVAHTNLHIFQAIFDNATHGIIGGVSWFLVRHNFKNVSAVDTINEVAACTFIACFIDIDHFLKAKSIYLEDATNLSSRPFLHCSTYPFLLSILFLTISYAYQINKLKVAGLLMLTAFASHHTRDATRRGYWFHPFGSTPPIPYIVYVGLTCIIPYVICVFYSIIKIEHNSDKIDVI